MKQFDPRSNHGLYTPPSWTLYPYKESTIGMFKDVSFISKKGRLSELPDMSFQFL